MYPDSYVDVEGVNEFESWENGEKMIN
jgi:hypothetical protein